jgi:hypothetical protein
MTERDGVEQRLDVVAPVVAKPLTKNVGVPIARRCWGLAGICPLPLRQLEVARSVVGGDASPRCLCLGP